MTGEDDVRRERHTIEVDGGEMAVIDTGRARTGTVVLVHGQGEL